MAADYVTGVVKALYQQKISSQVGFWGILKKGLILLMVVLAVATERLLGSTLPFRELTLMFYLANEGLSILENLGGFIPLPPKLKKYFEQLKEESQE